jgi:hypothetical protein
LAASGLDRPSVCGLPAAFASGRPLPLRLATGAFAAGVPGRDIVLSPHHAIHVEGVLIPAYCLRNDTTVMQLDRVTTDYFHVELPAHDVLFAEGLAVESYLDSGDRHAFANGGGVTVLFAGFAGDQWEWRAAHRWSCVARGRGGAGAARCQSRDAVLPAKELAGGLADDTDRARQGPEQAWITRLLAV